MIELVENIDLPNTISIDVEQYYHAQNLSEIAPRKRWPYLPDRVVHSTDQILEILDLTNTKATFFILGTVARRNKNLVNKIASLGHEIASHGFRHQLAYRQTPAAFFRDVDATKKLLEDICGNKVIGYRAPNFSITDINPWAHEILYKAGYRYDSSIYPTKHPRYSNSNKPRSAFIKTLESGNKLTIFPLAVASIKFGKFNIPCPVGGGAYWRLLPLSYLKWGLNQMHKDKLAINCYTHPWEFDSAQPIFADLSIFIKIRHYGGISSFPKRFTELLRLFSFATIDKSYRLIEDHQLQINSTRL